MTTTPTDWRTLCAELLDDAAELADLMQDVIDGDYVPDCLTLQPIKGSIVRARAALAQPEPEDVHPWPIPGDAEGLAEVFWGPRAQPEPEGPTGEDAVAACPFDSFHEPAEYYGWWSAIEWAEQHWCRPDIEPVPTTH